MVYNLLARLFPLLNDGFLDYLQKIYLKREGKYVRDSQGVFAEGRFCCAN